MISSNLLDISKKAILVQLVAGILLLVFGVSGIVLAKNNKRMNNVVQSANLISTKTDLLSGQWQYLNSANKTDKGLEIVASDYRIVEQDGSGGQANPPVNLYGTYLNVNGDFQINTKLTGVTDNASVRFYGKVPVINDEFRVEPPSSELVINKDKLTINMWDGRTSSKLSLSPPAQSKTFNIVSSDNYDIAYKHLGNKVEVEINGKKVASVSDLSIYKQNQLWFGASTNKGSFTISELSVAPINKGKVAVLDSSKLKIEPKEGVKYLASQASLKRPGFLVGGALALGPSVGDSQYAEVAYGGNLNLMTTENALKWQFIHTEPNTYNFKEADALVELAHRHNIKVHGHTLVFSEANPMWVKNLPTGSDADKQAVKKVMTDHITQVVSRYKGKISSWDVVNEPMADYDDMTDDSYLRSNKWLDAMGEDYIATAFKAAHLADPNAQLFINDYGLEFDGDRWDNLLKVVTNLKKQGVPIDGVGFEAHVYEAGDKIDPKVLKSHIEKLESLGLKARVSEIDVYDDDGKDVQAKQYLDVFNVCISTPNCISFTSWGVSDRYDTYKEDDTYYYGHDYLWDDNMRPTKALNDIMNYLSK